MQWSEGAPERRSAVAVQHHVVSSHEVHVLTRKDRFRRRLQRPGVCNREDLAAHIFPKELICKVAMTLRPLDRREVADWCDAVLEDKIEGLGKARMLDEGARRCNANGTQRGSPAHAVQVQRREENVVGTSTAFATRRARERHGVVERLHFMVGKHLLESRVHNLLLQLWILAHQLGFYSPESRLVSRHNLGGQHEAGQSFVVLAQCSPARTHCVVGLANVTKQSGLCLTITGVCVSFLHPMQELPGKADQALCSLNRILKNQLIRHRASRGRS